MNWKSLHPDSLPGCHEPVRQGQPDTRFALELRDLTEILQSCGFNLFQEVANMGGVIKAIKIEDNRKLSRKDLDELRDYVADFGAKGLAWARVNPDGWSPPSPSSSSPKR